MANPCDLLLKDGLFDFRKTEKEEEFVNDVHELFTRNRFNSKQSAKKFAGSLGLTLPIEALPVPIEANAAFDYSANKSETFSDRLLHYYNEHTEFRSKFKEINKQPVIELGQLFVDCNKIQKETGGIYASVEYSGLATEAIVHIAFREKAGDNGATPFLTRQKIAEELSTQGYTLENKKDLETITLIDGGEIHLRVTIGQAALPTPKIVYLPVDGNNLYEDIRVHFVRIWETPREITEGTNIQQIEPIYNPGGDTFTNTYTISFPPHQSDNIVIGKLRVWLTVQAKDANPSVTTATGTLKVTDMFGRLWFKGSCTSSRPHGTEVVKTSMPYKYFRIEHGDQMKFIVEVSAIAPPNNLKTFTLQAELIN